MTKDEVARIARLARLRLADEELEHLAADLGRILDYIGELEKLSTADVPATFRVDEAPERPWRVDEVRPGLSQEQALAAAADQGEGFFRVRGIGGELS